MSTKTRLKRLEHKVNSECFADVLSWIHAGRFFDELSPEEQERYCLYRYGENFTEPPETHLAKVFGSLFNLHFKLEVKPKPLTQSEIRKHVEELDEYMKMRLVEESSPEHQANHRKEYERLQEIGRKRKEAFYAGIPMDTYPLPWE